ncbi:hypothetical protein RB653_001551 [Dictyostelium firmibasis]|uniref:TgrO1-like immunoglobulin-like domain-containing protein n=1 Tax=Dictyostelium firmibasis TaxID=79012 RepID=A0AAN7U595_9MYCE
MLGYVIVFSNETFLSYEFQPNSDYFTSFTFEHNIKNSFLFNFSCNNSTTGTKCSSQVNENDKKQMYGISIMCTSNNISYSSNSHMYPTPIVWPPFNPPTKGGDFVIKGSYLLFSERTSYFLIIYPDEQQLDIVRNQLDATNVTVKTPSGCGNQVIRWANGKTYSFNYANPTISNISITSSSIIVNGSNFCDKFYPSNITIDGNIIKSTNIEKDQDSIVINYSQLQTIKSVMKIETSNVTSIEVEIEFKPEPLIINSVPINKNGLVIIEGLRFSSSPISKSQNDTISVKIGNLTCFNAFLSSNKSISCNLIPVLLNSTSSTFDQRNLRVLVSINNIVNENNLLFNYGIVKLNPNKYSLPNRVLQLNGDCLGNSNDTVVYLNGKITKINDLQINYYETILSFKIPDEFKSKLNVSVKYNNVMSNEIQIDISFYSSLSNQSPNTNGNSIIIFTLYNIIPANYYEKASIRIKSDQARINGTPVNSSNNSTNQDIQSFSFLIPSGCGKKDIDIIIGNQSCPSSITYSEPIISNCIVSGFGSKNDNIICYGNFGNKDYFNQSSILFSKNEILPLSINSTTLSFPLISGYHTDDLIFEMCDIESKPFRLSISPSLKRVDGGRFETVGGKFYIIGEFFSTNLNASVFCNDIEYKSFVENSTTISFDIIIPGPNDLLCNYSFDNGKNSSNFKIEYPLPFVEKTSTITTNGGILTIYGKNFYNVSSIIVEVDNQLLCKEIKFIDLTSLSCKLPPIEESEQSSVFNQKLLLNSTTQFSKKLLLNVTFDSKTWSGYIFQFSKDEIQNSNSEKSSNETKGGLKENKKKGGIYLSKKSKLIIGVVISGVFVPLIIFSTIVLIIRRSRQKEDKHFGMLSKLEFLSPEEKLQSRTITHDLERGYDGKSFQLKCNFLSHATRIANFKSDLAYYQKEWALEKEALEKEALEKKSSGKESLEKESLEKKSLEKESLGKESLEKESIEKESIEKKSLDNLNINNKNDEGSSSDFSPKQLTVDKNQGSSDQTQQQHPITENVSNEKAEDPVTNKDK